MQGDDDRTESAWWAFDKVAHAGRRGPGPKVRVFEGTRENGAPSADRDANIAPGEQGQRGSMLDA
jgi:hypothetical protein